MGGEKLNILIVDDNKPLLVTLQKQIELLTEHEPFIAGSLSDVKVMGRGIIDKIDLLLCDYILDGYTGIDVIEFMREELDYKNHVIIMSGHIPKDQSNQLEICNPYEIIYKPFTIRDLLNRLNALVEHKIHMDME